MHPPGLLLPGALVPLHQPPRGLAVALGGGALILGASLPLAPAPGGGARQGGAQGGALAAQGGGLIIIVFAAVLAGGFSVLALALTEYALQKGNRTTTKPKAIKY